MRLQIIHNVQQSMDFRSSLTAGQSNLLQALRNHPLNQLSKIIGATHKLKGLSRTVILPQLQEALHLSRVGRSSVGSLTGNDCIG